MPTIDNLTLEITANTNKAVTDLNKLATALSALKKASQIRSANLGKVADNFENLRHSCAMLNMATVHRVERLADALDRLSKTNWKGINGIKNAMANVKKLPLNDSRTSSPTQSEVVAVTTPIVGENTQKQIEETTKSVGNFWTKYQTIQNMIKSNPISLLSSAGDIEKMKGLSDTLGLSVGAVTTLSKALGTAGIVFAIVTKAVSAFSNSIKKVIAPIKNLIKSLGRIALYRAIRSILKGISQGLREGIQNLALYSKGLEGLDTHNANEVLSRYASAFLYVKNAIATAVMPALRALIPLVEQAMFRLVDFINVIAQVGSAFFGTDFTKAKYFWVDYADSLDNANGRAKALHHQLAQFDELNNLTAPSGGSGSDKVKDALDMFEEAKIDSKIQGFVDKIKNAFNTVKEMFAPVKKIVDKAKELFSLSWEKVSPNLKRIWDSIKKIWNQTLKPFITGFIDGFVDGFLMTDAFQNLPDLLGWISDKVADVAEAFAKWKTRIDPELMEKFGKALGVVSGWIVGLIVDSTTVGDKFKDLKDKVKKLKDYLADLFRPELENLKNNLDALKGVVDLVIEKFWNFINPVSSLKGMVEQLKNAYQKFQDKCDDINQKIAESDSWFKKLLDKVIEVKDWFAQNNLFAKLQSNTSDSNDKLTTLKDTIQKIKDKAVEVKDWFTNTELFKKAIENANNFKSVLETIKNILDGLKNFSANIGFNFNSTGDDGGTGVKDTVGSGSTGGGNTNTTSKGKEEKGLTAGKDTTGGRPSTGTGKTNPTATGANKNATSSGGNYGGFGSLEEYIKSQKKKATGGFIPRGDLFIANEMGAEMIGNIGGNTAVANNNQITEAIATATYNAMARALSENGQNVNVVVEADGDRMFKVFQKKQRDWQRTTGLAY